MARKNMTRGAGVTRRDFLHGAGAMAAGTLAGGVSFSGLMAADSTAPYPPVRQGMRGNHPGSFDVAHAFAREGRRDWGSIAKAGDKPYDLVVVGGGISGLSAAFFFQQRHPNARILILDNHDDFGGHAKRNEFHLDGRMILGYGGSQTIQEPSKYSKEAKRLLKDLGIQPKRFETAYDQNFYKKNGLGPGLFFNKNAWGADKMVKINLGMFNDYLPLGDSPESVSDAVSQMPISQPAKEQFLRLMTGTETVFPDWSEDEVAEELYEISYRDYLEKYVGITEQEVFDVLQDLSADSGTGIDGANALEVMGYGGMPGLNLTGGLEAEPFENYIHHFPDGNASVARLIVKKLIPDVAPDFEWQDVVTARFDYGKLDQESANVRIRLNSTVINVTPDAPGINDGSVTVTYIEKGVAKSIQANACIMACNHSVVPHICPALPEDQREALSFQERTPILYNSILINNWRPFKEMGVGAFYMPGSYFIHAALDFPVSIGGYSHGSDPDMPAIVHMEKFYHVNNADMTKREQAVAGRYELFSTSFEDIEAHIRDELGAALAPAGFDHERDIRAITANRWGHGYAYSYDPQFDDMYDDDDDERYPHIIGRKKFGRISFANSDSGAMALLDSAIDQAYRAVKEQA